MNNFSYRFALTIFILLPLFILTENLQAQISDYISAIKVGAAKENENLKLQVEFTPSSNIKRISIFYRTFGTTEYKQKEMDISGTYAEVNLPADDIILPYLEYYLAFQLANDLLATYPLGMPEAGNPVQIQVSAASPKDREVMILSPEKNSSVTTSEFFVTISLLRAGDEIKKEATKIYLDDADITNLVLFAEDVILFYAENYPSGISLGSHVLRVDVFDQSNNLYHSISSNFNLISEDAALSMQNKITYKANITGESRREEINKVGTWYNNLKLDGFANYKSVDINTNVYVTSEEKANLQPNNRFTLRLDVSDWMNLSVGDAFPQFPSLIMGGKRLRGVSGGIFLGFFNIQAAYGEINRSIEGEVLKYYNHKDSSINAPLQSSSIININPDLHNGYTKAEVLLGTYKRKIFALRPSFGKGENFQFGLTYLHAKDDPASIIYSAKPKENLVIGLDFMVGVDQQRIMLTGQGAISLQNNDISTGSLADNKIDSIFGDSGMKLATSTIDILKKIKKIIDPFITFNENLAPLNPEKFPTLAAEGGLALNYFNNYLKGTYIYRGNDFNSFGNGFIRTDVAGINIMDRLRLLDNKLFLSLGYENLKDNLQKTKFTTTTYKSINASVSFFPRTNLPNAIVSFSRFDNKNDLNLNLYYSDTITNSVHLYAVDDYTNRFSIQFSYDFEYFKKHSASISFSQSNRTDNSYLKNDIVNTSIFFSSNTSWNEKLLTNFNLNLNRTKLQATIFNYLTLSGGAKYFMLNNKLELNGSLSPSFGDFKRTSFDVSARYLILANFSAMGQFRYLVNSGIPNDFIFGISTSYNLN